MRVIVTGSRLWSWSRPVQERFDQLPPRAATTIVHGGAPGLDLIAATAAWARGFNIEEHPADWAWLGRKAGPLRNQHMVDLGADLLLAWPLPDSRGTWDCVRRARRAGIPVEVHGPSP